MPNTKYQTMDTVDALPTEYLLKALPKIPRGDVSLLYGDGAVGKGRLIMSWIAEVINDDPEAVVLICLPEDHPNEQIAPRLSAAGVTDKSRVINITRLPSGSRFKLSADTTHDGDVGILREIVEDINEPAEGAPKRTVRMIILDPIAAIVGYGSIQTNAGARRMIEPVQDLAMDTGISVVAVAHTVTGGKLQGSFGLSQAARLVYKVSKDRTNPTVRVISVDKANNLPPTEDLRFTLEDDGNGVRVVMLDPATIEQRQRSWRQPIQRNEEELTREPPATVRLRPVTPPIAPEPAPEPQVVSTRETFISDLLAISCSECSAPATKSCIPLPGSELIPVSTSPRVNVHQARIDTLTESKSA